MTQRGSPRVDYEPVATRFDERYEVSPLGEVADALGDVAREARARSALEVGCGTGRWLGALAARVPALFGLDPSPAMLWRAHDVLPTACLVRGRDRESSSWPGHRGHWGRCVR